jgi:hypothetical protein
MNKELVGEIIGSGGYGIVKDIPNSPNVVKLFRENVCETNGRTEYSAHQKIYEKYLQILVSNPILQNKVYIPKPINFHTCSSTEECYSQYGFSCAYKMEKVESSRADKIQEHLILNELYEDAVNIIKCKETEPISLDKILSYQEKSICEPRGAFLYGDKIKERIGEEYFKELPYLVGILHGIVFAAGYVPFDVEIVLDKNNRIAMYDFGMVYDHTIADYKKELYLDMYVPLDNQKDEYNLYHEGLKYVSNLLKTGGRRTKKNKKKKLTKKLSRRNRK